MADSKPDLRTLLAECREKYAKMTKTPWEIRSNLPYSWPREGLVIFSGRFEENETVGRWENEKYGRTQANVEGIVILVNAFPQLAEALDALTAEVTALREKRDKHRAFVADAENYIDGMHETATRLEKECTTLRERLERRTTALRQIIDWQPPKQKDPESGAVVSYAYLWGSNGECDYFRTKARRALEDPPRRLDDGTD